MPRDPRSEAEKARADLARNDEMGLAVPEGPAEEQPSVTPQTFGETSGKKRILQNGEVEKTTEDGQDIGDSTGTMLTSRDISETSRNVEAPPTHRSDRSDGMLTRAKE